MNILGRKQRALGALLLFCLASGSAAGCGGADEPGAGNNSEAECPIKCSDGSCVADEQQCEDETIEPEPDEIDGEVVDLSPRTILAHAPEEVAAHLVVSDAERVQALIDAGAKLEVELTTPAGTKTYPATAEPADADTHDFSVRFTPESSEGPSRGEASVRLSDDGKVYAWGRATLRLRDDITAFEFPDRDGFELEGTIDSKRAWSSDLDGDGIPDLIVRDVASADETEASVLRFFKCGADKCEPTGSVTTGPGDLDVIDQIGGPVDTDLEELLELLDFLYGIPGDGGKTYDVERVELKEGALAKTTTTIDLERVAARSDLHRHSIHPRLFLDRESGAYRPGIMAIRTISGPAEPQWYTFFADENGVMAEFGHELNFLGASEAERAAALGGQVSICPVAGSVAEVPSSMPDGAIVSTFEVEGVPMVAAGPMNAVHGPMRVFPVDAYLDPAVDGPISHAKCKLKDLDGDGILDIAISIAGDDRTKGQLLFARGSQGRSDAICPQNDSPDAICISSLSGLISSVDADDFNAYRAGESTFVRTEKCDAGVCGQKTAEVKLSDNNGQMELELISTHLSHPRAVSLDSADAGLSVVPGNGNDRVVRKRPGRKTYGVIRSSDTGGRPLVESRRLAMDDGALVLARFGQGLTSGGDPTALLEPTDEKTMFGWLSSTGPFNPYGAPGGGDVGGLTDLVFAHRELDKSTPLLMQVRVAPDDSTLDVVMSEVHLADSPDDEPTFVELTTKTIDKSSPKLAERSVVKFKTGAELSKAVNVAATDDDGCGDDACPITSDVLMAFQFDNGEVFTTPYDPDSDDDGIGTLEDTGLYAALLAELGLGDDTSGLVTDLDVIDFGNGPAPVLHGTLTRDGKKTRVTVTVRPVNDAPVATAIECPGGNPHFSEVLGEEFSQIICSVPEGGVTIRCLDDEKCSPIELDRAGDSPLKSVLDLDGDGCGDLLSETGEFRSSRCDGTFDPAIELGSWSMHTGALKKGDRLKSVSKPGSVETYGHCPIEFFDSLEMP